MVYGTLIFHGKTVTMEEAKILWKKNYGTTSILNTTKKNVHYQKLLNFGLQFEKNFGNIAKYLRFFKTNI